MTVSAWAQKRFGSMAAQLSQAVADAIADAHADAVAAQISSGTSKHDPYGHTLKRRQFECLVAHTAGLPGVTSVQPHGLPSPLVQIEETRCLLYPWRYATDARTRRADARIVMSDIRRALLAPADHMDGQLSIDDAAVPQAQWDDYLLQCDEEQDVDAQLRTLAPVVVIGFASNPTLLTGLGWGEAQFSEDGHATWLPWEPLSPTGATSQHDPNTTRIPHPTPSPVPAQHHVPAEAARGPRFDDKPLAGLPLSARAPLSGAPQQEEQAPASRSGTEDEQS